MCDVGRRTASGRAARFRSSNQPNLSFSYPAACLSGTAPDQLEQAVAGADHRPSASRISGRVPPTPGVDNAEKDGAPLETIRHRRPTGRRTPQDCRPAHRRTGRSRVRRAPSVAAPPSSNPYRGRQPEIGEQHDHILSLSQCARALQRLRASNGVELWGKTSGAAPQIGNRRRVGSFVADIVELTRPTTT
jgi:hypothetical protein